MGHALSHDSPSQAQSSSIPRRSRKASTNRPHGAQRVLGRGAGRRETDAVFETRAIHHLHRRTPHKAGRSRPDASGGGRQRRNPGEVLEFWHHKDIPDVVPPVLAYAGLLATHDGRNVEAARMIYEQRIAPALHAPT